MLQRYINIGLYDESTGSCFEESDMLSEIVYNDTTHSEPVKTTIKNPYVSEITEENCFVIDDTEKTIKIPINNIITFEP